MLCADRFRNSSTCRCRANGQRALLVGARPTGKIPVCTVPHGRLLSEAKLVPGTLKARFVRALPKKLIGDRAYDSDPLDNELASAASTSSHAISRRERSSRRLISDARAPWGHDGGPTGGGVADFTPAGRAEHLHSSVQGREEHLPHSVSVRWMNWTQIDPSPTADATRLTLFDRTSPTAKTPARLVSSKYGGRFSRHLARFSTVRSGRS